MRILLIIIVFVLVSVLIHFFLANKTKIEQLSEKNQEIFSLTEIVYQKNEEIKNLSKKLLNLENLAKELEARIQGDKVCGQYCEYCQHVIKNGEHGFAKYACELNCMCKEFKKKI